MKRIVAMGLFSDANQGDPLIHKTVKALYEKYTDELICWKDVDFRHYFRGMPRKLGALLARYIYIKISPFVLRCNSRILFELRIKLLSICLKSQFQDSNGVLLVGGGLIHYKCHDYWTTISASLLACKRLSIPMIINAVGIEGFDSNDKKCQLLSKYMRLGSLKYISTRDDVNTLKNDYLKKDRSIIVEKVIDPVIFCSKLFNVTYKKTDIIGVGLLRSSFIDDYRESINLSDLRQYYIDLINELEYRGIKWEFFTNGLTIDTDVIPFLESYFNRKFSVYIPDDTDQLMNRIASYRSIITARMHSCIVAYSFDVPAVAYNWCEKVGFWFDNIKHSERCIPLDALSGKDAVLKVLDAEQVGYEIDVRNDLESKHIEKIKIANSFL